jgi:type II secretion system protein G
METRGFTLIELLVVIAIIGVLSSVVLASLNSARAKTRDTARMSDLRQMETALNAYFLDNGSYPDSAGNWRGTTPGCFGGNGATYLAPLVTGNYISRIPEDPNPNVSSGNCYVYRSNGSEYMFLAFRTVESFNPNGPPQHSMDRLQNNTTDERSIAVYSAGAANW